MSAPLSLWVLLSCAARSMPPTPESPVAEPLLPAASGEKTPWPPDHIEGLHGWWALGDGLIAASQPTVVLAPDWGMPAGATLSALQPDGPSPVTVGAPETGTFGCDDFPVDGLTPLTGAVGGELIWLVSPTWSLGEALPLTTRDAPGLRTWTAGSETLGLTWLPDGRPGIWRGNPERIAVPLDRPELGDPDLEAELTLRGRFFVPQAVAAWRLDGVVVVGFVSDSLEGVHVDALVLGHETRWVSLGSLYRCAF